MEDLKPWRNILRGIDYTVIRALVEREKVSQTIGEVKTRKVLEVHQPLKEQEIIKALSHLYSDLGGTNPNPEGYIGSIYTLIIEQSRAIQYGISNNGHGENQGQERENRAFR